MNALPSLASLLIGVAMCVGLWAEEPLPTIAVRGSAKITLQADIATVTINLEGRAMNADLAFEKVDKQTAAIIALLKQYDVSNDDVRLQPITIISYKVRPENDKKKSSYSYQAKQPGIQQAGIQQAGKNATAEEDEEPAPVVAYQATRKLAIEVTNLSRLNPIQLGLVKNGVERIERIEFKSSKSSEEYAKLRQAAVKEALTKATAMASELGAELSSIKSIVDQGSPLPTNVTAAHSSSIDPFGIDESVAERNGTTVITHVAAVNVVFYLGKTELKR